MGDGVDDAHRQPGLTVSGEARSRLPAQVRVNGHKEVRDFLGSVVFTRLTNNLWTSLLYFDSERMSEQLAEHALLTLNQIH